MFKLSFAALTLVGLTGLALADDPKAAPKADPKAAPKADAKADPKAAPMPEMKPAAEIATMAKGIAGTWKCTGQGMAGPDKMVAMTATMTSKVEMGGWWIHETFNAKMEKMPFQFEAYTTYDPASKKWKRLMIEMGGGWSSGETAMMGPKMDWEMATHGPMGDHMFRDHTDATDAKAVKSWGEMSMDKGKTWMKVYEMTCKK
jgi:hypothetical protein